MDEDMYQDREMSYNLPQSVPSNYISEGMLREQINVNEILLEVESTLLGKEILYSEEGIPRLGKSNVNIRLVNEFGCKRIMLMLKSRINKIFQLSYFMDDHIKNMCLVFSDNVQNSLVMNWDAWEVRDTAAASTISHLLHDKFFATLQKAHKGKYLQYLANVYSSSEHNSYGQGMSRGKKKSLFTDIMEKLSPKK